MYPVTLTLSAALKDEIVTVSEVEFTGTLKLTMDGATRSTVAVEPVALDVVDGAVAEAAGVEVVAAAGAALLVADSISLSGGNVPAVEMRTVALLTAEILPAASLTQA